MNDRWLTMLRKKPRIIGISGSKKESGPDRSKFRASPRILFFIAAAFIATSPIAADPWDSTVAESPRTAAPASSWRIDLSGGANFAPSYSADVALLSAYGFSVGAGVELAAKGWIPIRGELDVYSIGASAWDPTLFRYRAFWGYRLAAMTGLRIPVGSGELNFLAGGALSASRFTGLSVVTSYASFVGEARFLQPLSFRFLRGHELNIFAAAPVEYMFRGTARTMSVGLEIGIGFQLPKGAAK